VDHPGRSLVIKTISDHKKARKVIAQAYEEVYGEKVTDLMKFGRRSDYIEDEHKELLNPLYIYVKLFRCVMLTAIFITMIGLFAISQYFIMERKQETAVRKIFGGTIHSETVRNTATYMKLAIISCIIAIPIIHTIFRIMKRSIISDVESTLWIYIVCILLSLIISIISVLWQTLRAARTNPAEALKKE
jgi:putative ABC transport system permease protein